MASALPNSTSPNWNIPKPQDEKDEEYQRDPSQTQSTSIFPLGRSFSTLGGGDAPMFTNMPRVRSQLFTISTRAVMTSQMSVNYTSATGTGDVAESHAAVQQFASSSSSSSVDSDIEEIAAIVSDVKPLNTDRRISASPTAPITMIRYQWNGEDKERMNALSRSKRCIHGSFEDLLTPQQSGSENRRQGQSNRRKSAPVPYSSSSRGQMIQAANDLLVEENKHLVQAIQKLKKKLIVSKIATMFTLEAVKHRGKAIKAVEAQKQDKEMQCAARLILHSLLLNSWRNTRRELDMRLNDNAELRKSVENFALQVQVLRHVQTSERQKAQEKANLIQNLNEELNIIKEENQMMRKEMEKMENELNSLQASSQNLIDENQVLTAEITKLIDMKDKLTQSLDWERVRSEQFSKENCSMKENVKSLEVQLKEATEQKVHWQERARCSESESWELQLHLESRNSTIKELTTTCETLRDEKLKLIDIKSHLKSNLDRTTLALKTLAEKNDELLQTYEKVKAEKNLKANKIQEMEKALETTKKEFSDIEKELFSYKLQNVRKRREWADALYFIVSPMDAVRRKLL